MQDNNIRKTIPEPLLFIHTVSTPVLSSSSRTVYDSRYKTEKKVDLRNSNEQIDEVVLKKINNIIQMVKIGNPVNCLIETIDLLSIECYPIDVKDDNLIVNENGTEKNIVLNNIKNVIILKV